SPDANMYSRTRPSASRTLVTSATGCPAGTPKSLGPRIGPRMAHAPDGEAAFGGACAAAGCDRDENTASTQASVEIFIDERSVQWLSHKDHQNSVQSGLVSQFPFRIA